MEKPYEKNHPIIDLLLPLPKLSHASEPPRLGQVSFHRSTLDTLQWSNTSLLKDFITCDPWALKPQVIQMDLERPKTQSSHNQTKQSPSRRAPITHSIEIQMPKSLYSSLRMWVE
jgi:hypothetical protein